MAWVPQTDVIQRFPGGVEGDRQGGVKRRAVIFLSGVMQGPQDEKLRVLVRQ